MDPALAVAAAATPAGLMGPANRGGGGRTMRAALADLVPRRSKPEPATVEPYRPLSPQDVDATVAEIKQLWWFHDGSIMNVGVRHHLWRSWGFCPRHTWLFAISELEMRGGSLLGTAVLYEDLVSRAAATVSGRRLLRANPAAGLRPRESCFTCDYIGHALEFDRNFADKTEQVNRRSRVSGLLRDQAGQWRPRACPVCLGGTGIPCRPHLLAGDADPPRDLGRRLVALRTRTAKFLRSQTWRPPALTAIERIAWVEAVGFFGGWAVPDVLSRAGDPAQAPPPLGGGVGLGDSGCGRDLTRCIAPPAGTRENETWR